MQNRWRRERRSRKEIRTENIIQYFRNGGRMSEIMIHLGADIATMPLKKLEKMVEVEEAGKINRDEEERKKTGDEEVRRYNKILEMKKRNPSWFNSNEAEWDEVIKDMICKGLGYSWKQIKKEIKKRNEEYYRIYYQLTVEEVKRWQEQEGIGTDQEKEEDYIPLLQQHPWKEKLVFINGRWQLYRHDGNYGDMTEQDKIAEEKYWEQGTST
jgi:hypothetical protein